MGKKQYLLTCEYKNTGRIITRHCGVDNLEKAKKSFMNIIKNVVGIKIKGNFENNFKILKKELV